MLPGSVQVRVKMMNFVLKPRNCALKTRNCASKTRNFVFKWTLPGSVQNSLSSQALRIPT